MPRCCTKCVCVCPQMCCGECCPMDMRCFQPPPAQSFKPRYKCPGNIKMDDQTVYSRSYQFYDPYTMRKSRPSPVKPQVNYSLPRVKFCDKTVASLSYRGLICPKPCPIIPPTMINLRSIGYDCAPPSCCSQGCSPCCMPCCYY